MLTAMRLPSAHMPQTTIYLFTTAGVVAGCRYAISDVSVPVAIKSNTPTHLRLPVWPNSTFQRDRRYAPTPEFRRWASQAHCFIVIVNKHVSVTFFSRAIQTLSRKSCCQRLKLFTTFWASYPPPICSSITRSANIMRFCHAQPCIQGDSANTPLLF